MFLFSFCFFNLQAEEFFLFINYYFVCYYKIVLFTLYNNCTNRDIEHDFEKNRKVKDLKSILLSGFRHIQKRRFVICVTEDSSLL